jgi:hypothetical protein
MHSAFSKLGGYLAGFATVGGIAAFAKSSIHAYDEMQQAQAQIQASIRSMGNVAGRSFEQIAEQAENLGLKTRFGAMETEKAASILLTFGQIQRKQFDETIPLIQDMATKMGEDLPAAALKIGKALQDPIHGVTALRRVGVMLTDQQKEQIKGFMAVGQVAKAQEIILKELRNEFGGSALAAGAAGTGQWAIIGHQFKTFKEQLGENMMGKTSIFASIFGGLAQLGISLTKIPITEKMREQQMQANALVDSLKELNMSEEERKGIYDQLNQISPDIVKGLDRENIKMEDLNKNLKSYNENLERKMRLETSKELTGEAKSDYDKKMQDLIKFESGINKYFGKRSGYKDILTKGAESGEGFYETLHKMQIKAIQDRNKLNNEISRNAYESITGDMSKYDDLVKSLKELADAYNQAERGSEKLAKTMAWKYGGEYNEGGHKYKVVGGHLFNVDKEKEHTEAGQAGKDISDLAGASGGLNQAKVINIRIDTLQKNDVHGVENFTDASKEAGQLVLRIINNYSNESVMM